MTALRAKDALFCFAKSGFNFATRKTNLDTPDCVGFSDIMIILSK